MTGDRHARGTRARVALALICAALLGLGAAAGPADARMRLSADSGDRGWVRLSVDGAPGTTVELTERVRGHDQAIAALAPTAGVVALEHAAIWRCSRRLRHFRARSVRPDGTPELAAAALRTPTCRDRIRVILPARELRPGAHAMLRVTDSWGIGGVRTVLCYGRAVARPRCRALDLPRGQPRQVLRIPLDQGGRWLFTVSVPHGGRARRTVKVGPAGGLHVLVSGDSMTFGIPEALRRLVTGRGATVLGDTHPGTGLTKPQFVNWAAHAYVVARTVQPDVTFLLLGAAGDTQPLTTPAGVTVICCDQPWIDAYAELARRVASTLLRRGRALVYYSLLPAPLPTVESPRRVTEWAAVNAAIKQAAATFPDGVIAMDQLYQALTPDGVFHESIEYNGGPRTVRLPDGIHLSPYGEQIAGGIIARQLRADGVL